MTQLLIKYGNIVLTATTIHRVRFFFSGLFHFRLAAFSTQVKGKVSSTLAKAASLRINLNIDGALQEHILTHHTRKHLVY